MTSVLRDAGDWRWRRLPRGSSSPCRQRSQRQYQRGASPSPGRPESVVLGPQLDQQPDESAIHLMKEKQQ